MIPMEQRGGGAPVHPVSDSLYDGHLEFVVKKYKNGALSPYLFSLHEGDAFEISYDAPQQQQQSALAYPFASKSRIAMICGGTGITPMVQVLKEMALNERFDTRCVDLLFANNSVDDYLCQVRASAEIS